MGGWVGKTERGERMKFDELWNEVTQQNTLLASGKASMSSELFEKALKLAYDQGEIEGRKDAHSEALLNGLFGNSFKH